MQFDFEVTIGCEACAVNVQTQLANYDDKSRFIKRIPLELTMKRVD